MAIGSKPRMLHDKTPPRRRQVHNGTNKILYEGTEPGTFVLYFKDDLVTQENTSLTIVGKGAINNRISELFMTRLGDIGITTHFIKRLNMREQLVQATEVLPFTVTMHNIATGEFSDRLGLDENYLLSKPILEFKYKSKDLGHPVVAAEHIVGLGWANEDELDQISALTQRMNDYLNGQFLALGFRLAQFTVEFGRLYMGDFFEDNQLMLVDELSPDTMTLIDLASGQGLEPGLPEETIPDTVNFYQKIAQRLGILTNGGPLDLQDTVVYF